MRYLAALSMKQAVIAGVVAVILPASLLLIAPGLRGSLFGTTGVAGVQETQTPAPASEPVVVQRPAETTDPSRAPLETSSGTGPTIVTGTSSTPTGTGDLGGGLTRGTGGNTDNTGGGSNPGGGNTGGGTAKNGTFEIKGNAGGLYPGAQLSLELKLENASNTAIRITSLQVAAAHSDRAGCDKANLVTPTFVDDPQSSSDDIVVPRNGEATTTVTIGMVANPSNSCQNATWDLTYTGQAVKA